MSTTKLELVQCFGKKRTSVAVATVRHGKGLLKINGCPLETIQPQVFIKIKDHESKDIGAFDPFGSQTFR